MWFLETALPALATTARWKVRLVSLASHHGIDMNMCIGMGTGTNTDTDAG